jgi:hypothetical protein
VGSGPWTGLIPFHLPFQGAEGSVDGGQLTFEAVAPEAQHPVLALLVATAAMATVFGAGAAAEGWEHGMIKNVHHGSSDRSGGSGGAPPIPFPVIAATMASLSRLLPFRSADPR